MANQRKDKLLGDQKDHSQPGSVGTHRNRKIDQFPQVAVEHTVKGMVIALDPKEGEEGQNGGQQMGNHHDQTGDQTFIGLI